MPAVRGCAPSSHGAAVPAIVFDATGFVANQAQTPEALMGIRVLFTFVPAAFAAIGAVLLLFYPLNDKLVAQMERDLAERAQTELPPAEPSRP